MYKMLQIFAWLAKVGKIRQKMGFECQNTSKNQSIPSISLNSICKAFVEIKISYKLKPNDASKQSRLKLKIMRV